jgi:hypothetical protein
MTTIERDVRAEPMAGALGAEIHGIDLAADLDDRTIGPSPRFGTSSRATR